MNILICATPCLWAGLEPLAKSPRHVPAASKCGAALGWAWVPMCVVVGCRGRLKGLDVDGLAWVRVQAGGGGGWGVELFLVEFSPAG